MNPRASSAISGTIRKFTGGGRRGTILVLAAVMMVVVFAFAALTIDVGYMALTRTKLQNNADAAALAAAQELSGSLDPAVVRTKARQAASDVYTANATAQGGSSYFDQNSDVVFGKQTYNSSTKTYTYNWGDQNTPYNVVRVFGRRELRPGNPGAGVKSDDQRLPLFFAPVFGQPKAEVETSAIATYQPRDIMLVLDYSGSMCYDSRFYRVDLLGKSAIEANLSKMYTDLGSPKYGKLQLIPQYATLSGTALTGSIPHIDATYKGTSVSLVSTSTISSVRLQFSDSSTQTISASAKTGTFAGTGSNASKTITTAWVLSGSNSKLSSGKWGEQFDFTVANIKTALGLTGVAYPYPAGSWDEYISVVQSSSDEIADAGYQHMYGYMTWINYLQEYHGSYAETPDLWKTSEQPITILKSGVDLFVDYLKGTAADDKLGLSVYSLSDAAGGAKLESGLTFSVDTIKTISRQRQAAHYDPYTNIGKGMQLARLELQNNSRQSAFKLMVVMTDGVVNKPTSASVGRALVLSEASAAATAKIPILTISMGVVADTALMQQVADATGGKHFNVPGGADLTKYQADLEDAFREIASTRPVKLIGGSN